MQATLVVAHEEERLNSEQIRESDRAVRARTLQAFGLIRGTQFLDFT